MICLVAHHKASFCCLCDIQVSGAQESHLCIVAEQQGALERVLAVCDERCCGRNLLQGCIRLKGGECGLIVRPQRVQGGDLGCRFTHMMLRLNMTPCLEKSASAPAVHAARTLQEAVRECKGKQKQGLALQASPHALAPAVCWQTG